MLQRAKPRRRTRLHGRANDPHDPGVCQVPPSLREAGIGGVVYLQFNINEFGTIQDETVLKSAHPKLDKAALEALQCIPRMEPRTQQGRPVRVTYTIPVRFTIR